jgi:hypothetical protein
MMRYLEPPQYVLCVDNRENPVSLERQKLYRVVEPEANDPESYVRIVDESGEDYIFPRDWFVAIDLPQAAIDALEAA